MGRGSADEAVVVVKLGADASVLGFLDEDAVTYLRVKLSASGTPRVLEAKGGTWNRGSEISFEAAVMS